MYFIDRADAGRQLAQKLMHYKGQDTVICALPRGGVVVGVEVAKALGKPLDLVIPRKIGHPLNPEYAVCAVSERGQLVCNESEAARLDPVWLNKTVEAEKKEARRRRQVFMKGKKPKNLKGKTVIVIDDGVATGLTMHVAVEEVSQQKPARIIVAVPVISADTFIGLQSEVDEIVALRVEEEFMGAVGAYYVNFTQVKDDEVVSLINKLSK